MSVAQIAGKLRAQIEQFSGELCSGLPKVAGRFVREMVYGIQASQSMRLTEIGRALEERISLKKTEERLSRQIGRAGLADELRGQILEQGSAQVKEDTLLILDLSDLRKRYAKSMEYLAKIRDGSSHELGIGYWTIHVVGVESSEGEIMPLYLDLYSQEAPEFVSENAEILSAMEGVREATKGRGIWVMDRGGDRKNLFVPMLGAKQRFLVRLVGDRHLIYRGKKVLALDLAASCPLHYAEVIVREEVDREVRRTIELGYRKVRLPARPEALWLVVVKGLGERPLMLLTTEPMRKKRSVLWWAVEAYLTRWRVEETIRYVKVSYHLEDVRLLRYRALRNMMALLLAATYFTAVWLGQRTKLAVLAHHALKAAKRLFGIPDFRLYALADGIRSILTRFPGLRRSKSTPPPPIQLLLPLFDT